MRFPFKKIHHLIRYFLLIGIIVFVGYIKQWPSDLFLLLIGPSIYLAYLLKNLVAQNIWSPPNVDTINYFAFLLPVTLLYFGLTGFLLKQLWNERGKVRFVSILALILFILYVHYTAWKNLSGYYYIPPEAPAAATA
jgi:hypothetical protein